MKRKKALRTLFNIQSGFCAYCDKKMDINKCNTHDAPTIDHILPKSKYPQLQHDPKNMVCACRECNNNKADMPLALFIRNRRLVVT